jgi:hypothetical protein
MLNKPSLSFVRLDRVLEGRRRTQQVYLRKDPLVPGKRNRLVNREDLEKSTLPQRSVSRQSELGEKGRFETPDRACNTKCTKP